VRRARSEGSSSNVSAAPPTLEAPRAARAREPADLVDAAEPANVHGVHLAGARLTALARPERREHPPGELGHWRARQRLAHAGAELGG
jgi:hypothetical protein